MSAEPIPTDQTFSVEEYIALEEVSPEKHEFVNGRICAMAGGTLDHDTIANNVRFALYTHLSDGPCRVRGPDVRVRVAETVYYYPDALVTCDTDFQGTDVDVRRPRLIVEVLSETTEANDRGEKFSFYQQLASLEEYVLIDSRRMAVEVFRRNGGILWRYQRLTGEAIVTFESIAFTCRVADLYRRTDVQPPEASKES